MFIAIYFIIGIGYCIVNNVVRKLDTDEDYLLNMAWIFLWPIFILALLIDKTRNL